MSGIVSDAFGAQLPCGCRAEIVEDEIHVRPCCEEHAPTIESAARAICAARGIPLDIEGEW